MEKFFIGITVRSFLSHYNKEDDAIAKATALLEPLPPDVFYETTTMRSAANEAMPPQVCERHTKRGLARPDSSGGQGLL
jgi:hypothetical protein